MASRFRSTSQTCSFCKRTQEEVHRLIAGPDDVFICDECVELCRDILDEDTPTTTPTKKFRSTEGLPSPKELTEQLDHWVVGQNRAKKILSVAVYNHYKRINQTQVSRDNEIELYKSNILLTGPTGCGKTLLAQTLARILDVPFCIADATSLTEAGYVGEDVENILLRLIQTADYDIERAEKGIIYIDEIDKAARKSGENPSITRDVSGEGVQQALLKIIEGMKANVPPQGGRKHPHQDFIQIDTKNILFICAGAFQNLDRVIEERLGVKAQLGFTRDAPPLALQKEGHSAGKPKLAFSTRPLKRDRNSIEYQKYLLSNLNADDLVTYGLIPEFVGRLPIIATVDPLDKAALVKILTEPQDAIIKQFQHLFALDDVELVFTNEAMEAAAELALAHKTGARGLRTIIEEALLNVMYEIPSQNDVRKCLITADVINKKVDPKLYDAHDRTVQGWLDKAA